jgi:hypothetical protein
LREREVYGRGMKLSRSRLLKIVIELINGEYYVGREWWEDPL